MGEREFPGEGEGRPAPVIDANENPLVPATTTIRTKFTEFTGTFVIHCHRLNHEDNGLMALVNVIPAVSSYAVAVPGSRGTPARVEVRDGSGDRMLAAVTPFPGFEGTPSVAMADVNGDNVLDLLVGSGPGVGPQVVAYSGADGGHTVDFRALAADGITLLGRADSFDGGTMRFADDLRANIEGGDANYLSMLDEADAYIARNGLDLPEEPSARELGQDPDCVTDPILDLDLAAAGITSIVWATGYALDFGWMKLDAFDAKGLPKHNKGVAEVPGLYFLGLAWLSRRASPFIWGCWHDAKYLAEHIAERRSSRAAG